MSTVANALRSELWKRCWGKTARGETMNRVHTMAFRLFVASLLFCLCSVTRIQAQTPTPSPSPSPESAKPAETKPTPENPVAPVPAPPLPAGMTGSDANDPRAKLTPGMYNAGETAMGLKHVVFIKKPEAFQLSPDNPDDPRVQKTLSQFGA